MSDTLTHEDTLTRPVDTDDGDHDTFSHYVIKADIARAAVEGTPARALCGKVWVPTKDGEKYPVCPDCRRIFEKLQQ